MQVKITRFTTLVQNAKTYNIQQRCFFKAVLRYDGGYVYRRKNGERLYLFVLDQADLIHIGILGKLHGTENHYEIWMEGYAATGESGTAQYVGSVKAKSFGGACIKFSKTKEGIKKQWDEYFDSKKLSYWGCRLYDNETDARRAFG